MPNTEIAFPKETHTFSQLLLKCLKNTLVFLIYKKRNLESVILFRKTTQEEVSKVTRDLNTKRVARRVTFPPKLSNLILIFSQI